MREEICKVEREEERTRERGREERGRERTVEIVSTGIFIIGKDKGWRRHGRGWEGGTGGRRKWEWEMRDSRREVKKIGKRKKR